MSKSPAPQAPAPQFAVGQQVLIQDSPKHWREVTITTRKYVDSSTYPGWVYGHNGGACQNTESCYSIL